MDDSVYIQTIASVGGTIPPGTYNVASKLIVSAPISADSIVPLNNVDSNVVLNVPAGIVIKDNGSLSNLTIDGQNKANFLIDSVFPVVVYNCFLKSANTLVRLKDAAHQSILANNTCQDFLQGILVRAGKEFAPRDVLIADNKFLNPQPKAQMIVAYGDPDTKQSSILNLRILNNICTGLRKPYPEGTADQIVLHRCVNFQVCNNTSLYGGENGIAITQHNYKGIISNNLSQENDAHGIQISSLKHRSSDILVAGNRCINNALRQDAHLADPNFGAKVSNDVMAGLYIQDGHRISLISNFISDDRTPRLTKYGIIIGSSNDVYGSGNEITFADSVGALPVAVFNSKNVNLEF